MSYVYFSKLMRDWWYACVYLCKCVLLERRVYVLSFVSYLSFFLPVFMNSIYSLCITNNTLNVNTIDAFITFINNDIQVMLSLINCLVLINCPLCSYPLSLCCQRTLCITKAVFLMALLARTDGERECIAVLPDKLIFVDEAKHTHAHTNTIISSIMD